MTSTSATSASPLKTPKAQNLSKEEEGDGWEAAAKSGTPSKARITFNLPEENGHSNDIGNANKSDNSPNPQDATLRKPARNGETTNGLHNPNQDTRKPKPARRQKKPKSLKNSTPSGWKKRNKRGRLVRVAVFEDTTFDDSNNNKSQQHSQLPGNQFRTTLRRRATRKLEEGAVIPDGAANPKEYGDISLGMKLIVVGGRVIVQTLNALSDGRASPAQLAGVIRRGDVLLAIGNVSMVNLPINQLMEGLKPLSTPSGPRGSYKRVLNVLFEAGVGLDLLKSHEEAQTWKQRPHGSNERHDSVDAANDMFSLFPMVDQLSGAPLFEERNLEEDINETTLEASREEDSEEEDNDDKGEASFEVPPSFEDSKEETSPDELISSMVAQQQALDRERFDSDFFDRRENMSKLLRKAAYMVDSEEEERGAEMTQSERVELGTKVMKLAKALAFNMEDIDKGKDMRSFKTWSTNFSLRSGASARRRHILDTASLRSHRHHEPEPSMDDSVGSIGSGSDDEVDGDNLLLGLAAHDGIWRKQVVEALKKSIDELENGIEDAEEEEEEKVESAPDIDTALTNQLGNFLFGENMNKIITKKKKSFALPPEEITTVLFDLTTHIATGAPDEITVFGQSTVNTTSYQSSFGTQGKARVALRADFLLANRFILDEAIPVWLQSFKAFSLDQRRVLWPKLRNSATDSYAGSNTLSSDGDSLTVDSYGSTPKSPGRTKDLREIIEDQELDIETRAETCFLATYYFTQKILSQYSENEDEMAKTDSLLIDEKVVSFIQKYGAYLQIHTCLSFSAAVEADKPIEELLKVASYDPSHRDALKEIQRANTLTFYDSGKLSAVLKFLRTIRYELKEERRNVIRNMCVSAYPDVQPWQVRQACIGPFSPTLQEDEARKSCSEEYLSGFYYTYLSMLLHPVEGHEGARHNTKLVKEWCERSIGIDPTARTKEQHQASADGLKHFFSVASRASSDHSAFRRDLLLLLDLSMTINEHELVLDLAGEILDSRKLCSNSRTVYRVLLCLRKIGMSSLELALRKSQHSSGFRTLKRVLRLFEQMATSSSISCRKSIVVAEELYALLKEWKTRSGSNGDDTAMFQLIDFMVNESAPGDVLRSLVLWSSSFDLEPTLFARLNALLRRGVHKALRRELSGSLLCLKYARQSYTDENKPALAAAEVEAPSTTAGIWKQMSIGALSIDK